MKPIDRAQMLEATRLTRAGRLKEAMALLQSAFKGGGSSIDAEIIPAAAAKLSGRTVSSPLLDWTANLPGLQGGGNFQLADLAPSAGSYGSGTFSNAAGSRSYRLYVPSRRHNEPRPLIVMLHGCQQSADDFAAGTRMNFAAETRGCFVAYPEQPQAANAAKCWNWFRAGDQVRDAGEPSLIAGITRKIMQEYDIDPRRVYVAGLSAGGAAAAIMGEAYPDLYAAVGVHSGLASGSAHDLPSAFNAMRGQATSHAVAGDRLGTRLMPTIVFHGDQDTTVHPSNGGKVIRRANADAQLQGAAARKTTAAGDHYSHSVQYDPEGRSVLELWELHGAGHAWSGGSPAGSFTSPDGPDATEEMLRFFLEHRRPAD